MYQLLRVFEACVNAGFRAIEWVVDTYFRIAEACFNAYFRLVELVAWPFYALADVLWLNRSLRYKRGVNGAGWTVMALFMIFMLVVFNRPGTPGAESQLMLTNVMLVLCIIACAALTWVIDMDLRRNELRKALASARRW